VTGDLETLGLAKGDVVDVVVRGRVDRVRPASLRLTVETDPALGDHQVVYVWIPVEAVADVTRTEPTP